MSFSDVFNDYIRTEFDVNGIGRVPKPGQDMPLFDSFSSAEEAEKIANIINKHLNFEHDKAYVKESLIHPGTFRVFVKSVSEEEAKSNASFQDRVEKMKSELAINLRKNKLKEICERTKNFPETIPPDFFHTTQQNIEKIEDNIRFLANQTPIDSWNNTPIKLDNLRKLDSEGIRALEKLIEVMRQFPMRDEFDESRITPILKWKEIIDVFKLERQKLKYVDEQLKKAAGSDNVEQSISEIVGDYLRKEDSEDQLKSADGNAFYGGFDPRVEYFDPRKEYFRDEEFNKNE